MKTIKFRGKEADTGHWVYGFYFETEVGSFVGEYNEERQVIPKSVSQLAKDISGKEFFDGDIGKTKDKAELIVVLAWIDEHGMYAWLTPDEYKALAAGCLNLDKIVFWTYAFQDKYAEDVEVIGNVFDNPELLEL